jgi:uncharacterized protein YggE
MKKYLFVLGLLGIFAFVAADVEKPQNLITVSAQGEVEAEPDIAVVAVGVTTTELHAVDAYNKNNKTMEKVIEALKGAGIDKKDIATTRFSLDPQYDYSGGRERRLTGYQMSHTVSVKVRKMNTVGALVSKVADAGANDIGGINFNIDDPTKLETIARERAVTAAHTKALELAKAAGVKLGKVVAIAEGVGYQSVTNRSMRPVPDALSVSAPAPIEAGTLKIQISVTIQYEIEQ